MPKQRRASSFSVHRATDMPEFIRLNEEPILREVVRRKELPVDSFEVKALFGEVLYKLCRADCVAATKGYDAARRAIYVDKVITGVLVRGLERDAAR